jgi:hypothetical protein
LATGTPYVNFALNGVDQDPYYMNFTDGFSVAGFLTDHRWMPAEITGFTPGVACTVDVKVANGARPFAISIYEVGQESLDEDDTYQTAVSPSRFVNGGAVYLADWQDLNASVVALWKHQATVHVSDCTRDGSATTNATATATNVLDNSTAGWSASAAGWHFRTYGRWRQFGTATLGTDEVPCRVWCYAGASSGAGQVLFKYSQGTIATINVTATGWYTADATYRGVFGMDVLTIETKGSGANTVSYYAGGMFDYQT